MTDLIVDQARFEQAVDMKPPDDEATGPHITGIFVRARREGRWGSYDIYVLDKESLMTWLRSRGGDNPWAESVVAMLLNHA